MEYMRYRDYVVRLAHRLVRFRRSSMIDADDLISEALVKLWEKEKQLGELDNRIARNTIKYAMLEQLRRSNMLHVSRTVPVQHAISVYRNSVSWEERLGSVTNPIEEWVATEPVREIQAIIDSFSYEDRLLLSLIWEEGCSLQQAAEVLGISKSRVHQRYQELIRRIRARILVNKRRGTR